MNQSYKQVVGVIIHINIQKARVNGLFNLQFIYLCRSNLETMDAVKFVEEELLSVDENLPSFNPGDTVVVKYKIKEGNKERTGLTRSCYPGQRFGMNKTFTVRKISDGIGVERVFPLTSPNLESIAVTKKGKVRRAKLYYLRSAVGKKTRIKEKR